MSRSDKIGRIPFTKLIRKIFVAISTGSLTYLITNMVDSDQPKVWAITLTVFISGITFVVQFFTDFEQHMEKAEDKQEIHLARVQSLVEEGFAKMSEATALFQDLEASAMQTDAVTRLVRYSSQIEPCAPPLIHAFAQSQINQTSQLLKELSEGGQVCCDGEDRNWILDLTARSRTTIDATSLSTVDAGGISYDGGFWTTEFGQRYLELQRKAIHREVAIRRIFILDNSRLTVDSDFVRIYQRQQDLGIQTRVLEQSAIPHDIKNALFDFIVFDEVISYEVTPASRIEDTMKPTIVKTNLTRHPERVKERMQRFEKLWIAAQTIDELRHTVSTPQVYT
ncbi:MAG: hypothetical protein ACRDSR_20180 [Pseudonocardiaceae bacterium]